MERFRLGLSGLYGPRTQAKLYGSEPPSLSAYGSMFDAYEVGASQFPHWTRELAEELVARMPSNVALIPRVSRAIVQNGGVEGQAAELDRWLESVEPILRSSNHGPLYMPWTGAWSPEAEGRLRDALEALWPILPSRQRLAVEFRHGSWLQPSAVHMLEEYGAGLVWSTLAGRVPYRATADFIYARLTGHQSRRVADEVQALTAQLESRPSDRRTVFAISSRYHDPYGLHALERFADRVGAPLAYRGDGRRNVPLDNPVQPSLRAFAVS